jgi:hypothetical protein
MSDKNFKSYDGAQEDVSNVVLDPIAAGWAPGSWADTCKFWRRRFLNFDNFTIVHGGTEDGVDMSSRNCGNFFKHFVVAAGNKYVLTLKGSSTNNHLVRWIITKPGKWVDVQVGNWSDDDPLAIASGYSKWARSSHNIFDQWTRVDGQPVRYAYRYGCKPLWINSNVKHLWWMSVGLTIYWYAKYFYVKKFGGVK